jgi:cytochrome bd ubiquinol oxidase subunit I
VDDLLYSRILTGTTLGFHIFFAALGVGIPVLISLAEFLGLRKKDSTYLLLAKRWARGFVILVAVGVVTGTCIGFQINLLWPNFMQMVGEVISLPFMAEAFAFFLEAIFLGIWLYTWDRFKNPWIHWLFSLPVIIGSSMSAALITTVNAFMNAPAGFQLVNGTLADIDPMAAIFNPATPSKLFHVLTSAYFMTACLIAALTALLMLVRKNRNTYYKTALNLTMVVALITGILTAVAGDMSAKYMAEYNPEKLAAAEALFETTDHAPLLVGGLVDPDTQEIKFKLELPGLLSFMSFGSFDAPVQGLNDFPKDEQPPYYIHYMFQVMVASGTFGIVLAAAYLFLVWRKKAFAFSKPVLIAIIALGPIAVAGLEFGWIFTEIGRKPWIIYKVMKMADAVTQANGIKYYFIAFTTLYVVIGATLTFEMIRFSRKNPVESDPRYLQLGEAANAAQTVRREGGAS